MAPHTFLIDNLVYNVWLKDYQEFLVMSGLGICFTIHPYQNRNDIQWRLFKGKASKELVDKIGVAIENSNLL
jgi:hypothetical protein